MDCTTSATPTTQSSGSGVNRLRVHHLGEVAKDRQAGVEIVGRGGRVHRRMLARMRRIARACPRPIRECRIAGKSGDDAILERCSGDRAFCSANKLIPAAKPHLSLPQPCSSRASSLATSDDGARRGVRQRHRGGAPGGAAAYVIGRAHPEAATPGNGDIAVGAMTGPSPGPSGSLASSLAPPGAPSPR